ncbi:UDP-glucose 4-epimerase [Longispora fulva]|uniref:UDP-glucose 4-epimerase n=1 Tax=Longispora fulva TaxID=619741 RepID=A0A8J7GV87_9ACTN|nr:NAD-dependent epimerase/dehydratase family protein [Longispora fulva]MBG6139169.1 UDP-glucose 4-epimerase [Longispora fulva]GIG58661.1 UDP-glucose 4-epimerase [Longispora fulva]
MNVLVTGGLGYLGRAVTLDLLAAGHQVAVLSRARTTLTLPGGATLVHGDVRDRGRMREVVAEGRFDAVCHLAALAHGRESFAQPLAYFDVNVGGTLNLLLALEAAKLPTKPRFVFASTNIVYGSIHSGALTEDMEPHPESPYAESKLAAERLVAAQGATGALAATSLRLFNLAGAVDGVPDTDKTRIIPNALRAASGESDRVTLNGNGSAVRDFVHVLDVATAFRLALEVTKPGQHGLYNIGSGTGSSMAEVVRVTKEVTGVDFTVEEMPPKPEPQLLVGDIKKASAGLNWAPTRSGLRRIVEDAWLAWRTR